MYAIGLTSVFFCVGVAVIICTNIHPRSTAGATSRFSCVQTSRGSSNSSVVGWCHGDRDIAVVCGVLVQRLLLVANATWMTIMLLLLLLFMMVAMTAIVVVMVVAMRATSTRHHRSPRSFRL
jgi:hypothetical protein